MVVRIRLARFGHKNRPYFRMWVADSRRATTGRFIEQLGTVDPIPDRCGNKHVRLNTERTKYWLQVGAQPSERVKRILGDFDILPPAAITWAGIPAKPEVKAAAETKQPLPSWMNDANVHNMKFPVKEEQFSKRGQKRKVAVLELAKELFEKDAVLQEKVKAVEKSRAENKS